MARNHHHQNQQRKQRAGAPPPPPLRAAPTEKKLPVVYGKPFVLLEDDQRGTFIYDGGQWVRHSKSIAQCRADSQVRQLPQKINGMTRYEICCPLA